MFNNVYRGKKVFLTGHTGFKGSWLALWLKELGADVYGYSLPAPTNPSHLELLNLDIKSKLANICDEDTLFDAVKESDPDIIFHLAAQPLVRYSYENPKETYLSNVIGTLNIFEASRRVKNLKAVVNITTDKVYENNEWVWGYREIDPLGGYDPYSSSKACADILTSSYRRSFFNPIDYGSKHNCLIASARAGNVIGGGDWAIDRLVPDIVRTVISGDVLQIRSPNSVRPWQHVLEPLYGYLVLGQNLLEENLKAADAWNFGPNDDAFVSVRTMVERAAKEWKSADFKVEVGSATLHEAGLLKLDSTKAKQFLGWDNIWSYEETLQKTFSWYEDFYNDKKVVSREQLEEYSSKIK